jgi:hypothetical protein
VHFLQERVDLIVLAVGDGYLNRVAQRVHLATFTDLFRAPALPSSRLLCEMGESGLHWQLLYRIEVPQTVTSVP